MGLPANRRIMTWFEGKWQEGNVPIMGSADHGTWLGTMVFDGARWSSPYALADSVKALTGRRIALTDTLADVDTAADLRHRF